MCKPCTIFVNGRDLLKRLKAIEGAPKTPPRAGFIVSDNKMLREVISVDPSVMELAESVGQLLETRQWRIAAAESCTGGGIAAAITSIAGSSAWFEYGLVTYANQAKQKLLGVTSESLATYGAVSEAVVTEMARGALAVSAADIAVATSGIAGPGGAVPGKPVGTVWFAWATASGDLVTECCQFAGNRVTVQRSAVIHALRGVLALAEKYTV